MIHAGVLNLLTLVHGAILMENKANKLVFVTRSRDIRIDYFVVYFKLHGNPEFFTSELSRGLGLCDMTLRGPGVHIRQ